MVEGTATCSSQGPDVIKTVTGEGVSFEDLGGAQAHGVKSGVAHYRPRTSRTASTSRDLLSYLPSNQPGRGPRLAAPELSTEPELGARPTRSSTRSSPTRRPPYDMHEVITHVLDDGGSRGHAGFAPNILTGFGRVEGAPVGVVANQPMHLAGCLDSTLGEGGPVRRTCDAFASRS